MTREEIKELETKLTDWTDYYSNARVTNTHALSEKNLTLAKNGTGLMVCIAVLAADGHAHAVVPVPDIILSQA